MESTEPIVASTFAERVDRLAENDLLGVLHAELDRLEQAHAEIRSAFREGLARMAGEAELSDRERRETARRLLELDRRLASERVLPDLPSKLLSGLAQAPEALEAVLDEPRYIGTPTEPEWVQLVKFWRRRRRAFRRWRHARRGVPEPPPDTHTIPYRGVLQTHLLALHADLEQVASEMEAWTAGWLDSQVQEGGVDRFTLASLERVERETAAKNDALRQRIARIVDDWKARVLRDLPRAGTIERPARRFSEKRVQELSRPFERSSRSLSERWKELMGSQLTDLEAFQELSETEARMRGAGASIAGRTRAFFDEQSLPPLQRMLDRYRDMLGRLEATPRNPNALNRTLRELLSQLQTDPDIGGGIEWIGSSPFGPLRSHIDTVLSNLLVELDGLAPTHAFAVKRSMESANPKVSLSQTEWAEMIRRHVKVNGVEPLSSDRLGLEAFFTDLANRLNDTREIIFTNVNAALEPGEEGVDPRQVAASGIERSILQLGHILESVNEKRDAYLKNVDSRLPGILDPVRKLVLERDFDKLESRDTVIQVRERAMDWKTRLIRWLAIAQTWVAAAAGTAFKWSSDRYARLRQALGFVSKASLSASQRMDVTLFLTETDQKMRSLPFIYRRLFNPELQIDRRFFQQTGEGTLLEAWRAWMSGLENSVAIIGEKGSGKSTVLHFFKEDTLSQKGVKEPVQVGYVHLDVTETSNGQLFAKLHDALGMDPGVPADEHALVEAVQGRDRRHVVILDGLHNLFVRNLAGFDSLEAFWRILSQTRSKVFWVMSCTRYAWEFLQHMMQVDLMVSHLVPTDRLTSQQVQEAVLARHRATGYDLVFEPDRATRSSRAFKRRLGDPAREQEYLRELFFRKLGELSEGNLSVAMILWIRSIRVEDGHTLTIQPFDLPDLDLADLRDAGTQFTLAALAIHDALPPPRLEQALEGVVERVGNIVARLHAKGILTRHKEEYRINMLIYRQMVRMLKGRNFLH